ncbi:MAG: HAD family hydrolase [Solirubrobacterales bacterium]
MNPTAVICDFGGVLTNPLMVAFLAFQDQTGISLEQLGNAMNAAEAESGAQPLFELEKGTMSEKDFIATLTRHLEPELGHHPEMHRFGEIYFDALEPNQPMIDLMAEARRRGHRMAMLTNNVREWDPLWRPMLPVDDIFEFVVNSGYTGMRKPDPEIYYLTLEGFGGTVASDECLFIDDTDVNCATARSLGMQTVHFEDNDQAIEDIEQALGWTD